MQKLDAVPQVVQSFASLDPVGSAVPCLLVDAISIGVDRMQRNFEPMRRQVEAWQGSELTGVTAKVVIYEAFVEGRLEAPKHLARTDPLSLAANFVIRGISWSPTDEERE